MRICLPQDFATLIPGFLNNRQKDIEHLRDALQGKDFQMIKHLGHRLSGNGATYGFLAISACGEELEAAAAAQDEIAIQQVIQELANYLEKVEVVYE